MKNLYKILILLLVLSLAVWIFLIVQDTSPDISFNAFEEIS